MTATSTDLDQLSVNAIRALAMDAVQAANSGHPGTPMAMAPVVYTLVAEVPALRPRAIRSGPTATVSCSRAGHASTLLYALLHLAGVKAVNGRVRDAWASPRCRSTTCAGSASSDSKCPGHPEYRWTSGRRDHHRTARTGIATQRRDGDRQQVAGGHVQPAGLRAVRLPRVRPVRRRRPDGGHRAGGGRLAGHLRLDNLCWIYDNNRITHRGPHGPRVQRRRGDEVHRLRLERHAGRRRERLAMLARAFDAFGRGATARR